jgi:multidrug resistance efflux pump
MTIRSLRSHVRPDNLKNQIRPGQSLARRIYLGSLLLGAGWIVMQFVGPMVLMDADGMVLQERKVVMPSYPAQVISLAIGPGDSVRQGQPIATVVSAKMLDLISDLTTRQGQARSRQEQIKARLQAIADTMSAADKRVSDATEASRAVEKAKAGGFSTVTRYAEVAQERYLALREAASLRAEAAGLESERAALEGNLSRLTAALDKADQTYRDGEIVAPADGIVGTKVVSVGTVLSPGDHLAEIHHGETHVIAYFTTNRLYSITPGKEVVITDGVNRQAGHIQRLESIADRVPPEFQSNFRSVDRQQVVRVSMERSKVFPLLAKIKVTDPMAPSNLVAEGKSYVAEGVARAFDHAVAAAWPLLGGASAKSGPAEPPHPSIRSPRATDKESRTLGFPLAREGTENAAPFEWSLYIAGHLAMLRRSRYCVSRRRILALLVAIPVLTDARRTQAAEGSFRDLEKSLWVWEDRILHPENLDAFVTAQNVGTLFLYVTPAAAEALLGNEGSARATLSGLKSRGRRIYAMAGEPDWALGPSSLPRHVELLIRLQALRPPLFDGIHLDVEPNATPDWRDPAGRARSIEGTLRFYDLVRRHAPGIEIDAAVNPIFATLDAAGGNFLVELARRVNSVSIMAYRNRVQPTLAWAAPAVTKLSTTQKPWRMGVQVDPNDPEPNTSWDRSSRPQFETAMIALDRQIREGFPQSRYAGLVFQSFDGLRTLLAG